MEDRLSKRHKHEPEIVLVRAKAPELTSSKKTDEAKILKPNLGNELMKGFYTSSNEDLSLLGAEYKRQFHVANLSYGVWEDQGKFRDHMEDNYRIRHNISTEKNPQKITDETSKYEAPEKHIAFPKSLKDLEGGFKLKKDPFFHKVPSQEQPLSSPENISPTSAVPSPPPSQPFAFYLICDGYGGKQAADYTTQQLYNNIFENPNVWTNTKQAIIDGFLKTEKCFLEMSKDEGVGTTAVLALVVGKKLFIANIGDSEAVIFQHDMAITVTVNHTPKNDKEKERIEKLGGKIIKERLAHPVLNPEMFNVGVTRSIGNSYFKSKKYLGDIQPPLIAEPWVDEIEITDSIKFMVLATDGLWDTITPSEAVEFVWANKTLPPQEICRLLVQLSRTKGSTDNITAILVFFCNPKTDLKEDIKSIVL